MLDVAYRKLRLKIGLLGLELVEAVHDGPGLSLFSFQLHEQSRLLLQQLQVLGLHLLALLLFLLKGLLGLGGLLLQSLWDGMGRGKQGQVDHMRRERTRKKGKKLRGGE